MSIRQLIIEGAKQNNLKNVSLSLPHNRLITVTGLSGSGKSSLAFDTIFAEGQWRFIESLSTYARVFIEKFSRPDVDKILNIRPSIALQQHNPIKTARSTVGTLTEIYDLLRTIYTHIGIPYCPQCSRELRRWDDTQIAEHMLDKHNGRRAIILADTDETLQGLMMMGFERLWLDSKIVDISESTIEEPLQKTVVIDRLVIREDERLYDSLRTAWKVGKERLRIVLMPEQQSSDESRTELVFTSNHCCDYCGITLPEPTPLLFSFNHPLCACPVCKGFGNVLIYEEDVLVPDKGLPLSEGAIAMLEKESLSWWREQLLSGAEKSGIDINIPYKDIPKDLRDYLFAGNEHFLGLNDLFEEMENKRYKLHVRVFLSRYRTSITCPKCNGKRLCSNALTYKIQGRDISELSQMPVSDLIGWFDELSLSPMHHDSVKEALRQVMMKLRFLLMVGLDYLTLSRQSKTLSGGEYQRLNLSNQLASQLTGTLYVLDEPTIGLHPRDTDRIIRIIRDIVSLGNTAIVVEHDKDVIASSDFVVEMGPEGGSRGGEVIFAGLYEDFIHSDTLTARCLRNETEEDFFLDPKRASPKNESFITLAGACGNNLKHVDIKIPIGRLSVVTGVSGSGKSSLIVETLYPAVSNHFKLSRVPPLPFESIAGLSNIRSVNLIDQSPIGRTPRSNPATYLKIFEPIRKIFSQQAEARAHGYGPGFFSFNVTGGRCEACKGEGFQKIEMYFFEDVYVKCEGCGGSRYKQEALRVRYQGRNIEDILNMTVAEAAIFFSRYPEIMHKLNLLLEIGLGYLKLGQPANTLSGGEAQRLKICYELLSSHGPGHKSNKGILYILDEPTVGLHYFDVMMLMKIIRRLLEARNTVLIIEHNLDVIALAEHLIDLGPEGGDRGGMIVFQGSPSDITRCTQSLTGKYLLEHSLAFEKRRYQ